MHPLDPVEGVSLQEYIQLSVLAESGGGQQNSPQAARHARACARWDQRIQDPLMYGSIIRALMVNAVEVPVFPPAPGTLEEYAQISAELAFRTLREEGVQSGMALQQVLEEYGYGVEKLLRMRAYWVAAMDRWQQVEERFRVLIAGEWNRRWSGAVPVPVPVLIPPHQSGL